MQIFKACSVGNDSIEDHWYMKDDDCPNVKFLIWQGPLSQYSQLHNDTNTIGNLLPIMPEVLRWAKIAADERHKAVIRLTTDVMKWTTATPPASFKDFLPDIIDLMIKNRDVRTFDTLIQKLYPHNPTAFHAKLKDICDCIDDFTGDDRSYIICLLNWLAHQAPEVFNKQHISCLLEWQRKGTEFEQRAIVAAFKLIADKCPQNLVGCFDQLCDDSLFTPESLMFRASAIGCVGNVSKVLGEKAIDYLMKFIDYQDETTVGYAVYAVKGLMRKHKDFLQKYVSELKTLKQTATLPYLTEMVHQMLLVLEGKSVEKVAKKAEQQQKAIDVVDKKVDTAKDVATKVGGKVIKHDKAIGELEKGRGKVERRVENIEKDTGATKTKVKEIDKKTITNVPKWSSDLCKLINPSAENDWKQLALRLGFNDEDIVAWSTKNNPCMAVLAKWYTSRKIKDATLSILTALLEIGRTDAAAIVENAMKLAEGVVSSENFKYPKPPPVFISYQWGKQNEAKLLQQHLIMAGYECWMDVGQMGEGDKLFAKIDDGIRRAKVVIACVTETYALSPNCNREVSLSVNLNKPIIPLLMEKMEWPPKGSMGPIFSEHLFIRFFLRGDEKATKGDKRFWPTLKFQELLMRISMHVVPNQKDAQKEYSKWWSPLTEGTIEKSKNRQTITQKSQQLQQSSQASKKPESPVIFLSYQWSKQPQVKTLYQRLTSKGYTVWMDVYQMGGGDSLYEKIDKGIRGCKVLVSCVTKKYTLSANCRREVSLADALMTPIIPLLLEQTEWPPDGPMRNTFAESDYFNCYKDVSPENTWKMEIIDQLISTINQIVQQPETVSEKIEKRKQTVGSNKCNIEDKSRSTTVTKPRLEKTPGVAQSSKSTSSAIQKRNKVSTPAKH